MCYLRIGRAEAMQSATLGVDVNFRRYRHRTGVSPYLPCRVSAPMTCRFGRADRVRKPYNKQILYL